MLLSNLSMTSTFFFIHKMIEENRRKKIVYWKGVSLSISYCILKPRGKIIGKKLMLTGWGSGYLGQMAEVKEWLLKGYVIYLIDIPGYGDSDNPPIEFFKRDFFKNSAFVLAEVLKSLGINKDNRIHVRGHSSGGELVAWLAADNPDLVKSLVLINTSGIKNYSFFNGVNLAWRFTISGAEVRKRYGGTQDPEHQLFIDYCGEQKSAWWPWRRFMQRIFEFIAISQGALSEVIGRVECPILLVTGMNDTVFPYQKSVNFFQSYIEGGNLKSRLLALKVFHNPTLHKELLDILIEPVHEFFQGLK